MAPIDFDTGFRVCDETSDIVVRPLQVSFSTVDAVLGRDDVGTAHRVNDADIVTE